MSQLALSLIEECIRTQNPYLDLGCCGLTDALVAEGTPIDIALRQCTHLATLIFSNRWWKGEWINSQNTGEKNFFTTPPPPFLYSVSYTPYDAREAMRKKTDGKSLT